MSFGKKGGKNQCVVRRMNFEYVNVVTNLFVLHFNQPACRSHRRHLQFMNAIYDRMARHHVRQTREKSALRRANQNQKWLAQRFAWDNVALIGFYLILMIKCLFFFALRIFAYR